MAPEKVKLAFIADEYKRKTSYKKRKQSLLKKTEELSTLCGVEACAIVYGLNESQPEIWASESGVQNVLGRFRRMPESMHSNRMVNQESFLAETIAKGKEKMEKLVRENKEKEMFMFMMHCLNGERIPYNNNMTEADLNVVSSLIEQNLKDITQRMETLNVNPETPYQPQMQTPTPQDMNTNPMQGQKFMDLLNGNGDDNLSL